MAINYPTSLDNFTNPTSSSPINSPSHADQHSNANDAIEALEAKVGVTGSTVSTSHDYRITQVESLVTSAVAGAKSIYQDVRNQSGSSLSKATPVYVSGSEGASGKMLISAASNTAESTSSKTMGITTSAIANNSNGQVISEGILEGIDTTGAADGDPVWLGTNGAKIYGLANKPSAPSHLVFLGVVIRGGQANTGSMYVKIQNGFELEELHNVQISSLINGNIIAYDSTAGTWKNTNTLQSTSSTVPLVIKGSNSQTANLQEWQTSTGQVNANIGNTGAFYNYIGMFADNTNSGITSLTVTTAYAGVKPLIVKGAASQTANLQEWQNSSGTNLLKLSSTGKLIFGSGNSGGSITSIYFDQVTTSTNTPDGITWNFVTTNTSSAQVMAVRTAASYATDLYFTTANAGDQIATERMRISSTGNVAINGFLSSAVGLVIKGAASQTANLQEWQDSSGTLKASINSYGDLINFGVYTRYLRGGDEGFVDFAALRIKSYSTSVATAVIKSIASQTSNLTEWQNSAGTVLNAINASGNFIGGQFDINGNLTNILYIGATRQLFAGNPYAESSTDETKLALFGKTGQTSNFIEIKSIGGVSGKLLLAITPDGSIKGGNSSTISANTATTVDTVALSSFTTIEYVVSIKQGSKIRSSKVLVHTDGTSVDSTEYGIMEMGGGITGIIVTASVSGTDSILQVTITDAATTNATVKLIKTML